ncbi:MAG: sugar phosphate isomerase/epimerase [Gemmatimonadaceae bacterium]|nr:sugar phosphate isomerase/epimerase [Gemmatimonadaceae bacterium]
MQGRFSPLLDGRIQAFPVETWREEFLAADESGFHLMEWTLDYEGLYENPLMTVEGRATIAALSAQHRVLIPSLTGDCFMQRPFWKMEMPAKKELQADFDAIVRACASTGIAFVVVPLVDHGKLDSGSQEADLLDFLVSRCDSLKTSGVKVLFESDMDPAQLGAFIAKLDRDAFGINYDLGNSASLGYDPFEEMASYGHRVANVHVKDRKRGGTTVPLGMGDVDFPRAFSALARAGYSGNYILQTARAADENHDSVLCMYRDMTFDWVTESGA